MGGGTQIKLNITFTDGGKALMKPWRYVGVCIYGVCKVCVCAEHVSCMHPVDMREVLQNVYKVYTICVYGLHNVYKVDDICQVPNSHNIYSGAVFL